MLLSSFSELIYWTVDLAINSCWHFTEFNLLKISRVLNRSKKLKISNFYYFNLKYFFLTWRAEYFQRCDKFKRNVIIYVALSTNGSRIFAVNNQNYFILWVWQFFADLLNFLLHAFNDMEALYCSITFQLSFFVVVFSDRSEHEAENLRKWLTKFLDDEYLHVGGCGQPDVLPKFKRYNWHCPYTELLCPDCL